MKKKFIYVFVIVGIAIMAAGCKSSQKDEHITDSNIELGDYKNLKVTVEKGTVTEESVKSYMERLVESYSSEEKISFEELTDEYVATYMKDTGYTSIRELEDGVREYLNSTNDYYAANNTRTAISEELTKVCKVKELPEGLLDERVESYIQSFRNTCEKQYGMTYEEYLSTLQITEETFRERSKDTVKKSLEQELILLEIAKQEEIDADENGYQEYIQKLMNSYGYEAEKDLYDAYSEESLKNAYICNKVLDKLAESTEVTFVAVGALND